MTTSTLTFKINLAWWFKPYIYTLAAFCALTGHEPNEQRLNYWIDRAMRLEAA